MAVLMSVLVVLAVAGLAAWATRSATVRHHGPTNTTLVRRAPHSYLLVGRLSDGSRVVLVADDAAVATDAWLMLQEGLDPRTRYDGRVRDDSPTFAVGR